MSEILTYSLDKPLPNKILDSAFIVKLLKYADDIDVGLIIKYCNPFIFQRHIFVDYDSDISYRKSNKEILLEELISSRPEKNLLLLHLNALSRCYNSFNLFTEYNKNKKFEAKLERTNSSSYYFNYSGEGFDIILNGNEKVLSYEDKNTLNDLTRGKLKEIFSILINNYYKYSFYYYFDVNRFFKSKISATADNKSAIVEIQNFEIKHRNKHNSLLCDEKTGLKIDIGKNLKVNFESNKCNNSKFFKTLNARIYEILNGLEQLEDCSWCNPGKENTTKHGKCSNCENLLKELQKISKMRFNAKIRRINYDKAKNINDLRRKRKSFLKEFVNSVEIGINTDQKCLLEQLISNTFAEINI